MACSSPLKLSDRIVPCGTCYYCKLRRVNSWVVRLLEQQKISDEALFITLTYENERNDKESDTARTTISGRRTLVKRDLQLFFKRVRKLSEKSGRLPIKYYAVGEYGRRSGRPHYHAIVFNASKDNLRKCWLHGFLHEGTVTSKSIAYCLKYINKGRVVPENNRDDRQKEFSVMSKGMGSNYLTPNMIKYHLSDLLNRCSVVMPGGFKFPLPRYYRDKIYSEVEKSELSSYFEKIYLETWEKHFPDEDHRHWLAYKKYCSDVIEAAKRMQNYLSKENQLL